MTMVHYETCLPHWETVGSPLFVTFRLHGRLPRSRPFPPGAVTPGLVHDPAQFLWSSAAGRLKPAAG